MVVLIAPDACKSYQTAGGVYTSDEFGIIRGVVATSDDYADLIAIGCAPLEDSDARSQLASISALTSGVSKSIPAVGLRRTGPPVDLILPSPYSSIDGQMVHPSVVYISGGWNGYSRWMAVTPYPGANDDYENPCILASNDGETWVVPSGVTNPIVPPPADVASGAFNSDTHLLLSPDGSKLYILFRYVSSTEPRERLLLMESTNGRDWTSPVTIYSANLETRRMVSPSMWWDGSQYVIVAHDIAQANSPLVRMVNGGSDPYTGWPAAPTNATLTHPSAGSWWHSFFNRLPDGRILGLVQDGNSGGGNLYLADSNDGGLTFTVEPFDLFGGFYRSCFVVIPSPQGPAAEIYLGRISPSFVIRRASGAFDRQAAKTRLRGERGGIVAGVSSGLSSGVFADLFQRADAAALGTSLSGGSYTVDAGSFGISSNRAYITTTGNNRALTDLGTGGQNLTLFARFAVVGSQGWFIFRATDILNYWRLGFDTTPALRLQKIVAGSVADNHIIGAGKTALSVFEIRAQGGRIVVLSDGEVIWAADDTPAANQTKIGLQASGAVATYFAELVAVKAG